VRIAVFLELRHDGTGGFHQALSTVESLARPGATGHEIVAFTPFEETRERLRALGIDAVRYPLGIRAWLDRWSATMLGCAVLHRLRRWLGQPHLGRHLDAVLDDHRIDLVYLTECADAALRIGDHPFVVTIWDTFNRDLPEFYEVYRERQWEQLEKAPRASLTRALAVVVDSPFGARRVAELYQVDRHRLVVLPFLPALAVRRHARGQGTFTVAQARARYDLPERYVFWPSFPAPEKNHLYVMEALVELHRRAGIRLDAVFCGGGEASDWRMVQAQARALGLERSVHFLGKVPDDHVPALYEGALALVIPTYSGPTNLPPLEAASLGCPVIYSDLPQFREQMGEAALYCDLSAASNLAEHLRALIADPALRERLRSAGLAFAASAAAVDYAERLKPVFDSYAYVRRRWAWPQ
jgi:glycosyltransferase involved in cell wall biosynthesis